MRNSKNHQYWNRRSQVQFLLDPIYRWSPITRQELASIDVLLHTLDVSNIEGIFLNLGCGVCQFPILSFKNEIIYIDHVLRTLISAKSKNPQSCFLAAEAMSLPLKDNVACCIVAIGLTEYIESAESWLAEMIRLLVPGGWLLFTSSPDNALNRLRRLWSPPLYFRKMNEWFKIGRKFDITPYAIRKTLLQDQFLWKWCQPSSADTTV